MAELILNGMAPPKVTLYVRDDELWQRAREVAGPGGLSALVHQCLRDVLDRADGASLSPPSVLERARHLRQDAEALVRSLEQQAQEPPKHAKRQRRGSGPSGR